MKEIQNDFISADYSVPKSPSLYLKFEDGDTKFMPLQSVIVGFQYWTSDNKPVRLKEKPEGVPSDIKIVDGSPDKISPFWAFPVWNYDEKRVQVLEITQKTIMTPLLSLVRSEDWGNPVLNYSITVNRVGEKFETKYSVMPNPVKDVPVEITEAWEEVKKNDFDITRLFVSGDPFNKEA